MLCNHCKDVELIEGTLEGVSFELLSGHKRKRLLTSGVYGIKAMVCPKCGQLSNFSLDVVALKNIIEKNKSWLVSFFLKT